MTPEPPLPQMKRRSAGCWLVGCSSILIAAALTALAFVLPPIDLPDRLLARSYSPLNAGSPQLTYEPDLRLGVPADDASADFALKIRRLSEAEFRADSPDHPEWLPAARSAMPADYELQGDVYLLDARGSPPASLSIELTLAGDPARLSLRGWDGDTWRFLPSHSVRQCPGRKGRLRAKSDSAL